MDKIQLEPISNFNFLGIIINENINWSKHINKISYSHFQDNWNYWQTEKKHLTSQCIVIYIIP